MKSPHASTPEARCRHSGLFRLSRCFAVAAAVLIVVSSGAATPAASGPTGEPPHADTPGGSVSPEVAAARKKVADLELRLRQLQSQMDVLQSQKPVDPGKNATADEQKKYHVALVQWQAQVDKGQHQIDAVKQQLALAKKQLQSLTGSRSGTSS